MESFEVAKKARGRNGGRKPTTDAPKDKRTAQLRRAQRAFLEKKKKRLDELEQKEKEFEKLREENAVLRRDKEILIDLLRNGSKDHCCTDNGLVTSQSIGLINSCPNANNGKIYLQSRNDHELYQKVFERLFYVCNGVDCSFPIIESNPSLNTIENEVSFPSTSTPLIDDFWSDFGVKLENMNFFERLYMPVGVSQKDGLQCGAQTCGGYGDNALTCSSAKSVDVCVSDVTSYKVLLSLLEIWHHVRAMRARIYFNLEKLGDQLRKEAICFGRNIYIPLDVFVSIIASFKLTTEKAGEAVEPIFEHS